MISTVDPTPAFWGELAPMAPRLRGFDIMLYAMQRDDIPAMPERSMAGASASDPRVMPLAVTRRVAGMRARAEPALQILRLQARLRKA